MHQSHKCLSFKWMQFKSECVCIYCKHIHGNFRTFLKLFIRGPVKVRYPCQTKPHSLRPQPRLNKQKPLILFCQSELMGSLLDFITVTPALHRQWHGFFCVCPFCWSWPSDVSDNFWEILLGEHKNCHGLEYRHFTTYSRKLYWGIREGKVQKSHSLLVWTHHE